MQVRLLSGFLLLSCALPQNTVIPKGESKPLPYEDKDAYAVYAALLPSDRKLLIIQRETTRYPLETQQESCFEFSARERTKWEPVLKDYLQNNRAPKLLQNAFVGAPPHQLVDANQLSLFFERGGVIGGWKAFHDMFPKSEGFIRFSAVGFNREKTKAILYMGWHCGGLCGDGHNYTLERKNGKWVQLSVNHKACGWVS